MPAEALLIMRFDKSYNNTDSWTDKSNSVTIKKLDNYTTFNQLSILDNTKNCVYFSPYNKGLGFKISNANKIKEQINDVNKDFTIYFKYKINIEDMENITPIISYEINNNIYPLIYIKDKYFSFSLKESNNYNSSLFSKDVSHTFNKKWHTFCLTRMSNIYRFFIDGLLLSQYEIKEYHIIPENNITNTLYIGQMKYNNDFNTFNNGYLDDICIYDQSIYINSFIPPTNYFTGEDKFENYKNGKLSSFTISDEEKDFMSEIENIYSHTIGEINKKIKVSVPIKLKLAWNRSETFYNKGTVMSSYSDSKYYDCAIINVSDLSRLFFKTYMHLNSVQTDTFKLNKDDYELKITNEDKTYYDHSSLNEIFYYEGIYSEGMGIDEDIDTKNTHDLLPIVLFINNCCIKLSAVRIIKNQDSYALLIKNSELPSPTIDSLDILLFPFPIKYFESYDKAYNYHNIIYDKNNNSIYKNIYGEDNISPLIFTFKQNGTYGIYPDTNKCWYYLDLTSEIKNNNTYLTELNRYKAMSYMDLSNIHKNSINELEFIKINNLNITDPETTYNVNDTNNANIKFKTISKSIKINTSYLNKYGKNIPFISSITIPKCEANTLLEQEYIKFLLFKNNKLLIPEVEYIVDNDIIRLISKDNFLKENDNLLFIYLVPDNISIYIDPLYLHLDENETEVPTSETDMNHILINVLNSPITLNKDIITYFIAGDEEIFSNIYSITDDNKIKIYKRDSTKIENTKKRILCLLQIKRIIDFPILKKDIELSENIKSGKTFILHDLNISKYNCITLNNLICFDQYGKYVNNVSGEIYNLNIIKYLYTEDNIKNTEKDNEENRYIKYITCIYTENDKYIPSSYNNSRIIENNELLKNYLLSKININNFENIFYDLMKEFNFKFDNSLEYEENFSNFLNYIITYNQNILNPIYIKKSTVVRTTYDNTTTPSLQTFKNKNISNSILSLKINKNSFYIFFYNNLLAKWNNEIAYDNESESPKLTVTIDNTINKKDILDIFEIKNIDNILLKVEQNTLVSENF